MESNKQHCKRCDYDWEPYLTDRLPKQCPRCKSPYWNKDKVRYFTYRDRGL